MIGSSTSDLESLVGRARGLSVKQSKELAEILVGYDVANRYALRDDAGRELATVMEESGGLGGAIMRNLFGVARAMKMHIVHTDGREIAELSKGWSLFFHRVELTSGGQLLGAVDRQWSLLGRKYQVTDDRGRVLARIQRPLFKLWTYPVFDDNGRQIATISKRWGGLLTEIFTDADTYGVVFEGGVDNRLRSLLLAAMFLIDMTNTENNANSGGLFGGD